MAFVCQEIKGLLTYLLYYIRCRSSDETPWSPPLIDFQSSRRPPVAMSAIGRLLLPALDFGTVYLLTSGLPRHLRTTFRWRLKTHLFQQSYPDIVL